MPTIQIDPNTGERIQPSSAIQIDPKTGERVTAPSGPAPFVDTSNVAGAGSYGAPSLSGPPAANMSPSMLGRDASPGTATQRLFGDKPLSNSATVVGQHLKNLVTVPYHAFTDAPTSPIESGVQGTQGNAGLGLYRMLAKPTIEGEGLDRVPIAGPWARGVENDAKTYGAIPALLGLGTDIVAPKAAEGLFSGATNVAGKGMQAAASTPEAVKVAATRGLVTGSPGELLNRSLKPPVSKPDFEQSVEASLPSIAAKNPKGVSGFAEAANQSKIANNDWYQNLKAPHVDAPVDASPIANAQLNSIPITNQIENAPKIFDSTEAKANNYKTTLPLGTLDDVRKDTNAKLQAFYNKNGGDRYAALSDPETARTKATNDTSRDLVYDTLADRSGVPRSDIESNQNLYGHLNDVAEVAGKRATVAGRANPLSLQESLQLHGNPVSQLYNFGTSRLFKNLTDSDAVTNAAIDRYNNPNAISLPPRPTLFGNALSNAGSGVKAAGKLKPFFTPSVVAMGSRKK